MDLRGHKCYIQPIPKHEDSPKRKTKAKLKKDLKINAEASVYAEPPIFVYVDYEAMFSEDGTHLPFASALKLPKTTPPTRFMVTIADSEQL